MTELTKEEKRKYVFAVGAGGIKALATIEELRPFIEWWESESGQQDVGEDIEAHAYIFNRCYNLLIKGETPTPLDIAKLQLTLGRLMKYRARLVNYETLMAKRNETKDDGTATKKPTKRTRRPFEKV